MLTALQTHCRLRGDGNLLLVMDKLCITGQVNFATKIIVNQLESEHDVL